MAAFAYTAINAQGFASDGEIHAPSADAAREQLRIRGLLAEHLEELPSAGQDAVRNVFKAIKPKSLQVFSRQFATMIEAGLSVVAALVILEEQTDDKYLMAIIRELRADVEGGLLLSQAMQRHPKVFSRLFVSMVEAGEAAGILDQVLDRMAFQIERETKLKRRVKGAMMYPTMVLIFATLVLTGMLLFLVPFFTKVFATLGGKLPTLTQWTVNASDFIKHDWYLIIAFGIGSTVGFKRWRKTEHGKRNWDKFKLRLPMQIGDVVLKITMARFSRTFSTLVAAGVDIIKAIEITAQTAGNWKVEHALLDAKQKVHEGVPISQQLDKMLGKIADFYEEEVDASIQTLTSIIEPLMMIGVGLMVGVIIIAMYLPMFKMLSLVK
jgi:type IV pilus assembly protein PilC